MLQVAVKAQEGGGVLFPGKLAGGPEAGPGTQRRKQGRGGVKLPGERRGIIRPGDAPPGVFPVEPLPRRGVGDEGGHSGRE